MPEIISSSLKKYFADNIIEWHETNSRDFPWRHTKDPYKILIAELLLRKTTSNQVRRIYPKLVKKYDTVKKLSKADKDELQSMISSLGMGRQRTVILINTAREIVRKHNSVVPQEISELLEIPGIGNYAANCVMCFAYNNDFPSLDANFIRVINRFFGYMSQKKRMRDDKKAWIFANSLIPKGGGKNLNYAVLDLAALICKASKPSCCSCPVRIKCHYFKTL